MPIHDEILYKPYIKYYVSIDSAESTVELLFFRSFKNLDRVVCPYFAFKVFICKNDGSYGRLFEVRAHYPSVVC